MAQYPLGVTDFIPDYQPYQPDFNFTTNVLQLKQSQYDQNWSKLNNMYGQILNAPLTHDESVKKRDNTFKKIDFNLKRVTGLDLSLDQNVQQATQLFRPFYEDANLMKDMAWTKNTSNEKAIGEGKRYSTDEKTNDEYWGDGLRLIDYKIQEFKNTPYEQLTSFGDVKYTPYVNMDKKAAELAKQLNYKIKKTTPQGDWIITEQNGEQIIPPLQSLFYSILGKDPKIQEVYAAKAYLKRKDEAMANKDRPEFGGNADLAEKAYLNQALSVLKKQTELTKSDLINQKKVNDNMISSIEQSIKNGTAHYTAESALEKYKDANEKIGEMLSQTESDEKLITDNVNKTLLTEGGDKLSFDDLNQMRGRVDAVMASSLLQTDLDAAIRSHAFNNYELSYDPNPFAVQRQKYQYDSALISQRHAGQMELAGYKHQLAMEKIQYQAALKSGLYTTDGKGNLVEKKELTEVFNLGDLDGFTNMEEKDRVKIDPEVVRKSIDDMYAQEGSNAKNLAVNLLRDLYNEKTISDDDINYIIDSGTIPNVGNADIFKTNKAELIKFIKGNPRTQLGKGTNNALEHSDGTPLNDQEIGALLNQGQYETSLEKEDKAYWNEGTYSKTAKDGQNKIQSKTVFTDPITKKPYRATFNIPTAEEKLSGYSSTIEPGKTDPSKITDMTKRMMLVMEKRRDNPYVYYSKSFEQLRNYSKTLDDYAGAQAAIIANKKQAAEETIQKLKAQGYNYAEYMYDHNYNPIQDADQFYKNIARKNPDALIRDDGFSWATLAASTAGGGLMGAEAGSMTATLPGVGIGALIGAGVAGGSYLLSSGIEGLYNMFSSNPVETMRLINPKVGMTGEDYDLGSEFNAMKDAKVQLIESLQTPVTGAFGGAGGGLINKGAAAVQIEPGVYSPSYEHFLQVKGALNNLSLKDTENNRVSFSGVNTPWSDLGDDASENNRAFAAIYSDLMMKAGGKIDENLKSFITAVGSVGGGRSDKASVTFKLPAEYLKKWEPTSDDNKIWKDADDYNDVLKNGITLITDAKNLLNVELYKNSFKTVEQIRIEAAGDKGVEYKDPLFPNFSLKYTRNKMDPSTMTVQAQWPEYVGPGKEPEMMTLTKSLSNQGTNIRKFRDEFFSTEVADGKLTAGSIMVQNTQLMKQYGK
jgi:hypothetical protein